MILLLLIIITLLITLLILKEIAPLSKEQKIIINNNNNNNNTYFEGSNASFKGVKNYKEEENKKSNFTEQVDKNKSIIPDPIKQIEEYEKKTTDLILIILLCGLSIIAACLFSYTFFLF